MVYGNEIPKKCALKTKKSLYPEKMMSVIKIGAFAGVGFGGFLAYQIHYATVDAPPTPPIPQGVTRIGVSGYSYVSPPTTKAHFLADRIAKKYPQQYETWYYWSIFSYHKFLAEKFGKISFKEIGCENLIGHDTSPFVWLERADGKKLECIGGSDDFANWVKKNFPNDEDLVNVASKPAAFGTLHHASQAPATSLKF